jgi:hypothetical protein
MPSQLFALERYDAGGDPVTAPPELPPTGVAQLICLLRLSDDDVVLALVEGPDADTVTACMSAVGWRVDRITPATWLCPPLTGESRPESVHPATSEVSDV